MGWGCEMSEKMQEYQKADNEQRQARENRAEQSTREARKARAEQVLCNVLAANYARQISTPIYSLLKSAVMDFVGLQRLFFKIGVRDFIICENNGKKQLWFYKGEPSAAYNASIETLWKIKMPFISVKTHGFIINPLVHYYNGEKITDTKDISDEFVELVEQFKNALKGGEK